MSSIWKRVWMIAASLLLIGSGGVLLGYHLILHRIASQMTTPRLAASAEAPDDSAYRSSSAGGHTASLNAATCRFEMSLIFRCPFESTEVAIS